MKSFQLLKSSDHIIFKKPVIFSTRHPYFLFVQMASNDPDLPDPSADPQPGDLIEIFRPAYQHWALYLGDGYIINLTPVGQ